MASTNKTTNYELSQYVGTDKPTYLGDYNGDMLKIDTAIYGVAENVGTESGRITIVENDIGTMANLETTEKTNLVGAINEVNTEVGNTDTKIGSLSSLNTTNQSNIVNAINEVLYDTTHKGFAHASHVSYQNQNGSGTTAKKLSDTDTTFTTLGESLLIDVFGDVYNTGAGYNYFIGVNIDGLNYDIVSSSLTGRNATSGATVIESIPAGQHTAYMYIRGDNSASAITCAQYHTYGYTITEL